MTGQRFPSDIPSTAVPVDTTGQHPKTQLDWFLPQDNAARTLNGGGEQEEISVRVITSEEFHVKAATLEDAIRVVLANKDIVPVARRVHVDAATPGEDDEGEE